MNTSASLNDENVYSMSTKDIFLAGAASFYRSFHGRWVSFICAFLFLGAVCSSVQVRVWQLVYRSAIEARFLAVEMKNEIGPNFEQAVEAHKTLLNLFSRRISERKLLGLLWLTRPEYRPDRMLAEATRVLESATQKETPAKEAIEVAARILSEYASKLENISQIGRRFPKAGCLPTDELIIAENKRAFTDAVQEFLRRPSVHNAEDACLKSRVITGILLTIGPDLAKAHAPEDLRSFVSELEKLSKGMAAFAEGLPADEKACLSHYAQNVHQRSLLISAVDVNDVAMASRTIKHRL